MKDLTERILYGKPTKERTHCDRCGESLQTDNVGCYIDEVAEMSDRTGKVLIVHQECRIDSDVIA